MKTEITFQNGQRDSWWFVDVGRQFCSCFPWIDDRDRELILRCTKDDWRRPLVHFTTCLALWSTKAMTEESSRWSYWTVLFFSSLGTDDDAIIHVVSTRCNDQRQEMKKMYKTLYGEVRIHLPLYELWQLYSLQLHLKFTLVQNLNYSIFMEVFHQLWNKKQQRFVHMECLWSSDSCINYNHTW